jgi:hypothetical protein
MSLISNLVPTIFPDKLLLATSKEPASGSLAVRGRVRKVRPRLSHSLQVNRQFKAADEVHVCCERRRHRRLDMSTP